MGTYINHENVVRRITKEVMLDVFDDDQEGHWQENVDAMIDDAEGLDVETQLKKTYGDEGLAALRALGTNVPRSVITLCLDAFEIRMGRRHPEYNRGDWAKRKEELKETLSELRVREIELEEEPNPAYNEGAEVYPGDPNEEEAGPRMTFAGGVY